MEAYLATIRNSRSPNTAKAYGQALKAFSAALLEHKFDLTAAPSILPEEAIAWFADALKAYAPSTERLYLSAVTGFYEYLEGSGLAEPNLPRLKQLLKRRGQQAAGLPAPLPTPRSGGQTGRQPVPADDHGDRAQYRRDAGEGVMGR